MVHFRILAIAMSVPALFFHAEARAIDIDGRVLDASGSPLPYVRIRLSDSSTAPYSTTVFTTADGTFRAEDVAASVDELEVDAFRIGWKEIERFIDSNARGASIRLRMEAIENVAEQLPASAWLGGDPESMAYHMSTLHCSNCHQLGSPRVRAFSGRLAALPVEARAEAWLKRAAEDLAYDGTAKPWESDGDNGEEKLSHARVEAWEGMVQYMRWVTMRLGEHNELRWGLEEGSAFYDALLQPETSLFAPRDMAVIVPNLAHNFPVEFDSFTGYDDVERLGDYGVNAQTRIDEFVLPTFGWTREVAIAPGSPYIWFVETDKDRLGALDPDTGSVEWYDIPAEGSQGPHTMNADADGNLWVALENSFYIGRFDTDTKKWRLYPPPEGTLFGVTHDFAFNSDRHVAQDSKGRIWITDLGKNELWGINVETGDIKTYRMPMTGGETSFHSLLYGAAIDTTRDRVWWAQLYGLVGSFDTEIEAADRIVPFARGAGPRRLAIQEEEGVLWVPLFGSSELAKIDTETGLEIARYRIPDRGAAPYGVTLDKKRNAIWAATSNSDRIYRFDIDEETWRHYPMPRHETFIRMIEVDPVSGDVWTTYASLPVGKRDPDEFGTESANNMIVRLRPGD